jgi:hypothetical protein
VILGTIVALLAACGGGSSEAKKKPARTTAPTTTIPATTTTKPPIIAPLTGLVDPSGASVTRPALCSAAFVSVKARYHVKTGDINAGHNQMKLAAGNFAVSENTGIGSVANSANLQSVIGTVSLAR